MLEGSGRVNAIRCPFHLWTYGLEGDLRGAPSMPKGKAFDKSQHGLIEFGAAERDTWLFPNMTFAASSEAIWVYEATPLETGRCRVVMSVCFPPETIAHKDFDSRSRVYYERMDAALAEDIPALSRHYQGLASPFAKQGRFCTDLEPSVANFALWYADRLKAGL